jgi:two-component system response regulator FixJ
MADGLVVHVVDDDDAVRDSLAFLLETEGLSVQTYDSALGLLAQASNLAAGCVVTDIRMPEMTGLELVRRLKELNAPHAVVVMTGHGDVPLAVEAMKEGVVDFIEKPFQDEDMLDAIHTALRRLEQAGAESAQAATVRERLACLSARETEVLDGLIAGKANKVIAFDLGISPRTVEVYRANVMTKMQAASLSELVRLTLVARQG